jgi:hypothetical protein
MNERAGLGIVVHTGWAACVLAAGAGRTPPVTAREHLELMGDPERFVFHRASEMGDADEAERWVAKAREQVVARAARVLERFAGEGAAACAVVAKAGAMLPLADVLASHPRIHTAEGCFFRDALLDAASASGLKARVVSPQKLDAKDPRLADVGRALGKPWTADWKLATLAAWSVLA